MIKFSASLYQSAPRVIACSTIAVYMDSVFAGASVTARSLFRMSMSCPWAERSLDTTFSMGSAVRLTVMRKVTDSICPPSTRLHLTTSSALTGAKSVSSSCGYCESQRSSAPLLNEPGSNSKMIPPRSSWVA
eukprot:5353394-Prymnesium_polylepis.1